MSCAFFFSDELRLFMTSVPHWRKGALHPCFAFFDEFDFGHDYSSPAFVLCGLELKINQSCVASYE